MQPEPLLAAVLRGGEGEQEARLRFLRAAAPRLQVRRAHQPTRHAEEAQNGRQGWQVVNLCWIICITLFIHFVY